ncbi:MAG: carbonate dehydratase [Bacteroidota bacterium]
MAHDYNELLENNKKWVAERLGEDPEYFEKLAHVQTPKYLWIGCADSRIPPDRVTGTQPGEIFVHRNVANLVVNTDLNMLSVLQYAVEVLKVKHIIVCGHYNCGGVNAALDNKSLGLIDTWLRNIKDVYRIHQDEIDAITDPVERSGKMVELNVMEQVYNLSKTSIVQKAWDQGEFLQLHGWVYDIHNGVIKEVDESLLHDEKLSKVYKIDFQGK